MPYDRTEEWKHFSDQMLLHIEQYTKVQYGSKEGTEQITQFTIQTCWDNIMRYVNRRNSSVRGNEERLRDCLKIAHYVQFLYDKLKEELEEGDLYGPLG